MANIVKLKKSAVPGKVPSASDLEYGELAINYADGVIYYKRSDNVVKSISAGGASLYFGTEPPNDPNSGDTWIDSATGVEYRYVNDGDSSQWVELGLSVAEGITPGGTTGQVLVKASNDDYDTEWVDIDALPDQTGNSGKYLTTDGSTASWGELSNGGPITFNSTTISQDYTIASGQNGFSVGPITVADGHSVTVTSGQRWVVI